MLRKHYGDWVVNMKFVIVILGMVVHSEHTEHISHKL